MITEYVRYRLKDEHRGPEFEAAYAQASPSLEASPNCLGFDLARCHEEPDRYILRIEWDSMEGHLQGFRKGEHFKAFFQAVRPFVDEIEEMQHYSPTAVKSRPSLHDAAGGSHVWFRLARVLHEKMKADEVLGPMFARAAKTHVPHLGMWLVQVFGGPPLYEATLDDIGPMLVRHAKLDISEEQRVRFALLARAAVDEVLPADEELRQTVADYFDWGTHVAVSNSKPDHVPDPKAGVPTWGWPEAKR